MTKREVDAFILQLPPTEHPFHGNHWYHTGEYYLSRMEHVHEMIETEFQTNVPKVVYLVSANHLLHSMLTHFTFFLLILMVWNPQIQKIHLLETSGSNLRSMMPHSRGQVVAITGSITHSFTYDPFRNNSWIPSNPAIEQTIQGYYLGNIDSHPIPTAEWLQGRTVLQQHIQLLCPKNAVRIPVNSATAPASALISSDASLSHTQLCRKKRYLLYQRDQIRRLLNYEHLLPPRPSVPDANGVQGEDNSESDKIHVIQHSDDHGLCDLYHALNPKGIFATNASDIHTQIEETVFITTHGFQLTALFLLPPQTTVVEVFPYRYFKPSYFPLYPKLGIRHNYFQSQFRTPEAARYLDPIPQVRCLQDKPCRSYARNQDIWLSPDEINLIRHMISIEEM